MMADTTTTIPELALPILLHQVVHFSDAIIAQDVDRMKNWEALEVSAANSPATPRRTIKTKTEWRATQGSGHVCIYVLFCHERL
jgi:hypothetical protein